MRLLQNFFAVSSEISTDMLITFNIEQEAKKLLEAVFTREMEMMWRKVEEIETLYAFKQFFTRHQKLTTIFTTIPLKNKALNTWS